MFFFYMMSNHRCQRRDSQSLLLFVCVAETPPSDAVSGEDVPNLSQPPHAGEENSNSSMGAAVPTRGPEPPDLADKSSQSSMASLDDTGRTKQNVVANFILFFHSPLCDIDLRYLTKQVTSTVVFY